MKRKEQKFFSSMEEFEKEYFPSGTERSDDNPKRPGEVGMRLARSSLAEVRKVLATHR